MSVTDLHVVLHGTVAIFEYDNCLEVRIPNLGTECVYRAGNWLAETTIEPGAELELSVPGLVRTGKFDAAVNVCVDRIPPEQVGQSRLYARLVLPTPDTVYSHSRRLPCPLVGAAALRTWTHGSAVHELTYRNVDAEIRLSGHPWAPQGSDASSVSTLLSVIADPETRHVPAGYDVRSFEAVVSLFKSLDLHWPAGGRMNGAHDPALVGGNSSSRPGYLYRDLSVRNRWLADVGEAARSLFESPSAERERELARIVGELARIGFGEPPWCQPTIISRGN